MKTKIYDKCETLTLRITEHIFPDHEAVSPINFEGLSAEPSRGWKYYSIGGSECMVQYALTPDTIVNTKDLAIMSLKANHFRADFYGDRIQITTYDRTVTPDEMYMTLSMLA